MTVTTDVVYTSEEYLARERVAEAKSEYEDGRIRAMTGASLRHNLISVNILRELSNQLRGGPCLAMGGDMRVKVEAARLYTYPDALVVCGQPEIDDDWNDTLLNPTVLVEILSPSTRAYDRGRKLGHYRKIPSVREVLLVEQDRVHLEHHRLVDGAWTVVEHSGLDAVAELAAVGCRLALRDVYDRVAPD